MGFKLSGMGKLFFSGAAAYIMGKGGKKMKLPIKIKGTPKQVQAVTDAIVSSKAFQREVQKGKSIDQIVDKLKLRNLSKQQFRKLTNKPWPI